MNDLRNVLLLAAWVLPVLRLRASQGKSTARGQHWLLITSICFALFYTCLHDTSGAFLAGIVGSGAVYTAGSLLAVLLIMSTLRQQRNYQQAAFTTTIPGLHQIQRALFVVGLLVVVVILGIEGVWLREYIDVQRLTAISVVAPHEGLVVSQVLLHSYVVTGVLVGLMYPYSYLFWHRHRLDAAFREQAGHWRLACFVAAMIVVLIDLLVHTSTIVFVYYYPSWTPTLHAIANVCNAAGGPVLVGGLALGCLPQRVFWGARSYWLYKQLLPLHLVMRQHVAGIYLNVPSPSFRDAVVSPLTAIIALNRLRAEITDARFIRYGNSDTLGQVKPIVSFAAWREHLTGVAHAERQILEIIVRQGKRPAYANYLNAPIYQSLDYYVLLARALKDVHGNSYSRYYLHEERAYDHVSSTTT